MICGDPMAEYEVCFPSFGCSSVYLKGAVRQSLLLAFG